MTRQHRYTFMDSKPRCLNVLFWAAVIALLLLALAVFAGACR